MTGIVSEMVRVEDSRGESEVGRLLMGWLKLFAKKRICRRRR